MGKVLSLLTELQHGGEPRVPPVEVSGLALYQQWFDAVNVNPGGFRMRRPEALEETQGSTVGHDFSLITEGR